MAEPSPHPEPAPPTGQAAIGRIARYSLIFSAAVMVLKCALYVWTNSVAVFADTIESVIGFAASVAVLASLRLSVAQDDPSSTSPGVKARGMITGGQGWLILAGGVVVVAEAVRRLIYPPELLPQRFYWGGWQLAGLTALALGWAIYAWRTARRHHSPAITANCKHFFTDATSTLATMAGLFGVSWTGWLWLDPLVALVTTALIFWINWRLLWRSTLWLVDRSTPEPNLTLVHSILDEQVYAGTIRGYRQVRPHTDSGSPGLGVHIQIDPTLTLLEAHQRATTVESQIEQRLGPRAIVTAHVEPYDDPGADTAPTSDAPASDTDA